MTERKKKLLVDKTVEGHWKVILDNPPINLIDDSMYDEFYDLVTEMETDEALKIALAYQRTRGEGDERAAAEGARAYRRTGAGTGTNGAAWKNGHLGCRSPSRW